MRRFCFVRFFWVVLGGSTVTCSSGPADTSANDSDRRSREDVPAHMVGRHRGSVLSVSSDGNLSHGFNSKTRLDGGVSKVGGKSHFQHLLLSKTCSKQRDV